MLPTISSSDLISDQKDEVEEEAQSALHLGQQFTDFQAALKAAMSRRCVEAQFEVRYQVSNRKANIVVCLSGVVPLINR
jgi:predicted HicB family RNase H-like nuclease